MLKLRGDDEDGRPVLIFGLSYENLRRLKAGQPIAFRLNELGLAGSVIIAAGPTEEHIAREFVSEAQLAGAKVHIGDPPKGSLRDN
jgi:hypothetical protein